MKSPSIFLFAILALACTTDLFGQRVNNVLYNPDARVVRVKMGPLGGVRFFQKGYVSPRFYDSLDRNLPILLDFIGDSVLPIVLATAPQQPTEFQSTKAIAELQEENRKSDANEARLQRMSDPCHGTQRATLESNHNASNRSFDFEEFTLKDGTVVLLEPIPLKANEILIQRQTKEGQALGADQATVVTPAIDPAHPDSK